MQSQLNQASDECAVQKPEEEKAEESKGDANAEAQLETSVDQNEVQVQEEMKKRQDQSKEDTEEAKKDQEE